MNWNLTLHRLGDDDTTLAVTPSCNGTQQSFLRMMTVHLNTDRIAFHVIETDGTKRHLAGLDSIHTDHDRERLQAALDTIISSTIRKAVNSVASFGLVMDAKVQLAQLEDTRLAVMLLSNVRERLELSAAI